MALEDITKRSLKDEIVTHFKDMNDDQKLQTKFSAFFMAPMAAIIGYATFEGYVKPALDLGLSMMNPVETTVVAATILATLGCAFLPIKEFIYEPGKIIKQRLGGKCEEYGEPMSSAF